MNSVLCQRIKYSYLLIPKTTTCSPKLPSFLCNWQKVITYHQIPYFENHPDRLHHSSSCSAFSIQYAQIYRSGILSCKINTLQYSTSSKSNPMDSNKDCYAPPIVEKRSVFQRMKQMMKDYWHILIPVHIVTSIGWTAIFYVAAKNGVDIVGMLEALNLSERYLEMLRGSNAGHWAVTYALYKVFTPIRYTVTLGGTTMCIRYLNRWGIMKFPSRKESEKLAQSIKCAEEHKTMYGKPSATSKSNQPHSPKI